MLKLQTCDKALASLWWLASRIVKRAADFDFPLPTATSSRTVMESVLVEEIDFARTKMGELTLRRRRIPTMHDTESYFEVALNGQHLMSSLVNASEIALATIGLAPLGDGPLDVAVGGLGLGYSAKAALDDPRVASVAIVEHLPEVIGWHTGGLVPLGRGLTQDPKCKFVEGDFFGLMRSEAPELDPEAPGKKYHAILVDIDHSPSDLLHRDHGGFYYPEGLERLMRHLHPGGVFALWSAEDCEASFVAVLGEVFASAEPHAVTFYNPLMECDVLNTIYVARAHA
jgi:spermidine synthase